MGRTLRRETRTKSGSSNIDGENGKWRNTFPFTDIPNSNCLIFLKQLLTPYLTSLIHISLRFDGKKTQNGSIS